MHCLTSSARGAVRTGHSEAGISQQRPTRRVAKTAVPSCPPCAAQAKLKSRHDRPRDRGLAQSRPIPRESGAIGIRCAAIVRCGAIGPFAGIMLTTEPSPAGMWSLLHFFVHASSAFPLPALRPAPKWTEVD
jgi:hypothetical protein